MQSSTRLKSAGILIVIGSCLALVASLFMALSTWLEYFVPSHFGSVRVITEPFYVVISIIIFELFAFVLGLFSSVNTFKGRKVSLSILGATFLLIAGLLFFTNILFGLLPHVESLFGAYSIKASFYQLFGLPILILATVSIIIIVSRKKEFNSQENNPLLVLKVILILCLIISAFSILFSFVPYLRASSAGYELASSYPFYTIIVNAPIFTFISIALTFLIRRKYFLVPIMLTVLSLLAALLLPFIFTSIYPWIGSFVKGLVRVSPMIIILVIALVLEFQHILGSKLLSKVSARANSYTANE
jgi:hypothetical protein